MKFLYTTLLIVFSTLVFGQGIKTSKEFKVTTGTPYPVHNAWLKNYYSNGNDMISLKGSGKKFVIQKFDVKQLKEVSRTTYDLFPDGFVYEDVIKIKGRLFLFYSLWDKENQKEQLFVKEIDFDLGAFVGEDKLMLSINGKITGTGTYVGVFDKFSFNLSYDESKILVKYRKKPEEKNDAKNNDEIGLSVFDDKLNRIWTKEVEMPYTEKKMNNIDYSIDKEGNAYIMAKVFNDNSTKIKGKDGETNYHFELLRYFENGNKYSISSITVKDKQISSIWMYENPNNYMICSGYYSSGKALDVTDGLFSFKVNNKGEIYDHKAYEFPLDIINQFVSDKQMEKNAKKEEKGKVVGIEYLELKEFIIQADGSTLIVGEQDFVVTRTDSKGNTYTVQHNHDILVTKLDAKGNLAWMKKLPKRQVGYGGGFNYYFENGQHYFLYIDDIANLNLPVNQTPSFITGKGICLGAFKVADTNGEVSKLSLFDTKIVNGIKMYQFSISRIVRTGPKTFVVEAYKKKKQDILIKVELTGK